VSEINAKGAKIRKGTQREGNNRTRNKEGRMQKKSEKEREKERERGDERPTDN
jgi:hypothetical protein